MIEARAYARLSQQGREGSIDEQVASLKQYADERGIELLDDHIYNDGEDSSGFDEDRDEFQKLRQEVQDGEVDAVIVRDRARLSRDFDTRVRLLADLRDTETELHVVEEGGPIGLSDPQRAGLEAVNAAMDHYKKQQEINRSKAAIQARVDNENVDLGRPRFGMKYGEDGKQQVPGEDFDLVKAILEMRDDDASYRKISEEVGVPTSTVRRVIKRREWYVERSQLAEE